MDSPRAVKVKQTLTMKHAATMRQAVKDGTNPFSTQQLDAIKKRAQVSEFDELKYIKRCQKMALQQLRDIPDGSSDDVYVDLMTEIMSRLPPATASSQGDAEWDEEEDDSGGDKTSRHMRTETLEIRFNNLRQLLTLRQDDAAKVYKDSQGIDKAD